MTDKSGAALLGSISIGCLAISALILFVLFPWAETQPDPDAIEAPAWFVLLLLSAMSVTFGATAMAFVILRPGAK